MTRILIALALAGCAARMNEDPNAWRVTDVKPGSQKLRATLNAVEGMGDAGSLHPAVIAYMLAAPGSPVRQYFEAWRREAAGRGDDAAALTRAWAATVSEAVVPVLAASGLTSYPGVALVSCCATVDPLGPRLLREREARGSLLLLVVRNRETRSVMLAWRDRLYSGTLAWDASALPEAFDPEAALDEATVAAALIPLHAEARP